MVSPKKNPFDLGARILSPSLRRESVQGLEQYAYIFWPYSLLSATDFQRWEHVTYAKLMQTSVMSQDEALHWQLHKLYASHCTFLPREDTYLHKLQQLFIF